MKKVSADYIFPISKTPINKGVLIVENDGKIIDLIDPNNLDYSLQDVQIFDGIICPGFINTHCHLELSYLHNKIPQFTGLNDFISEVEKFKDSEKSNIINSIIDADFKLKENGIVALGDISNTSNSFEVKKESKIYYHNFIETYGFAESIANDVFKKSLKVFENLSNYNLNGSIVPHSPYSISEKLFKLINDFAIENKSILSIHNQESEAENEMFNLKKGKTLERINSWGIDTTNWNATGKSSLQSVISFLSETLKTLMVHNTFTKKDDIEFAENYSKNIWWCFCPNANIFIENCLPNFSLFQNLNNRITLGTDSLASNKALSILEEIKTISSKSKINIPLETLIKWATQNGAIFLGIENNFGTLDIGKKPGINLISKIDERELKLTENSFVKVLY